MKNILRIKCNGNKLSSPIEGLNLTVREVENGLSELSEMFGENYNSVTFMRYNDKNIFYVKSKEHLDKVINNEVMIKANVKECILEIGDREQLGFYIENYEHENIIRYLLFRYVHLK